MKISKTKHITKKGVVKKNPIKIGDKVYILIKPYEKGEVVEIKNNMYMIKKKNGNMNAYDRNELQKIEYYKCNECGTQYFDKELADDCECKYYD